MAGDPASYPHSNGCDLFVVHPDTRQAWNSMPFHPKGGYGLDEGLLEIPHVSMNVTSIGSEVQDWVSDDLTRTVVGHIAASPRFPHFDSTFGQRLCRREDVGAATVAAHADGQDVWMLDQKQQILDAVGAPLLDEPALKQERLAVRNNAEVTYF